MRFVAFIEDLVDHLVSLTVRTELDG